MIYAKFHVVASFTADSVKVIAGYVFEGKPRVLNAVQVGVPGLLSGYEVSEASKGTLALKEAIEKTEKALGAHIERVGVLSPSPAVEIVPVHTDSATVGDEASTTDVKNCVSIIAKNVPVEERRDLADVVPFGFRMDEGPLRFALPYGEKGERLDLFASKVFVDASALSPFVAMVKNAGLSVLFANSLTYAIGRYFLPSVLAQGKEAVIVSLSRHEVRLAGIKGGILHRADALSQGWEEALNQTCQKLGMSEEDALSNLRLFGLNSPLKKAFPAKGKGTVEAFSQALTEEITPLLTAVKARVEELDENASTPCVLTGSGSLLDGIAPLASSLWNRAVSLGKVRAFGARQRGFADLVGGLLLCEDHSFQKESADRTTTVLTRREEAEA